MHYVLVGLLALVLAGPAYAQVHVDIGIRLPAPPHLAIVPGVPTVRYAPAAQANLFFYSNQYWIFTDGGWHVSRRHHGPWIPVAPQFVPRPVLQVPLKYYRVRPGHWGHWRGHQAPRWDHEWGRKWAEKREWRARRGGRHEEGPWRDRGEGRWGHHERRR